MFSGLGLSLSLLIGQSKEKKSNLDCPHCAFTKYLFEIFWETEDCGPDGWQGKGTFSVQILGATGEQKANLLTAHTCK